MEAAGERREVRDRGLGRGPAAGPVHADELVDRAPEPHDRDGDRVDGGLHREHRGALGDGPDRRRRAAGLAQALAGTLVDEAPSASSPTSAPTVLRFSPVRATNAERDVPGWTCTWRSIVERLSRRTVSRLAPGWVEVIVALIVGSPDK